MSLISAKDQPDLPRRFEMCFAIFRRLSAGTIEISLPDGRHFSARGENPGPTGRINVANPEFFTRLIRDGEIGFPEMFMEGWWTTPDLQQLLDVLLMNNEQVARAFPGAALIRFYERLRHRLRGNSKAGSRRNIAYHYDLGNDFYRLWLDDTMTYSSAIFSDQDQSLVDAQWNKYGAICDQMNVKSDDHVLEIGCGWGGFAEYAIRQRGARVTGVTLSREQHDYARKRLFEAGLAERAEIEIRDYRDLDGEFDGVASIEMFEAVGEKYWPQYFQTLHQRLRPGRTATLQVITVADRLYDQYRSSADFIQKYIFPGGMLPSPTALRREAESAGFDILGSLEFGESYSRTLREWRAAFNANWRSISELGFDERFYRMWNFYLAVCAACFKVRTSDVTQISLCRNP